MAGKRAGLKHSSLGDEETTRSGLFMDAVRIIKEMRKADEKRNRELGRADDPVRPRWAIYENVPGAFSSNKGQDFRVVLEELARIADKTVSIPMPQKGKWTNAGEIHGDGWSIAWRALDAQYHGVPQRRRRIFLVADFGGGEAGRVLFEEILAVSQSLRGNPPQSREEGQTAPGDATNRIAPDDREGAVPYTLKIRSGVEVDSNGRAAGKGALIQKDKSATLGTSQDQYLFQPVGADIYNHCLTGDKAACLSANSCMTATRNGPSVVALEPGIAAREGGHIYEDVAGTLRAKPGDNLQAVAYGISSYDSNAMKSSNPHSGVYEADTSRCLDLNGGNPACNQGGIAVVEPVAFDTYNMQPTGDKTVTLRAGSEYNYAPVFVPKCFDARGNGDGNIAPTITGDHENRITDYTAIAIEQQAVAYNGENITSPLNKTNPQPGDPCHTLSTDSRNYLVQVVPEGIAYAVDMGGGKSSCMIHDNQSPTLTCTHYGAPAVGYAMQAFGKYKESDTASAMKARDYKDATDLVCWPVGSFYPQMKVESNCFRDDGISNCLINGTNPGFQNGVVVPTEVVATPIAIDRAFLPWLKNALYEPQCYTDGTVPTLVAKGPSAVAAVDCRNATEDESTNGTLQSTACHNTNSNNVVRVRYIVRRLTPKECARLQGFDPNWGMIPQKDSLTDEEYRFWVKVQQTHAIINGKKPWKDDVKVDTVLKWYNGLHTDSAEYKMWGNGVALPCVRLIMRNLAAVGAKTLASLFDGSGGFPLAGRLEGIEPRWSSEVEPYPIAVTVHQFGGLG